MQKQRHVNIQGTVSVLFTDMVDSTGLLGEIGDSTASDVFVTHLNRLRDVLIHNGGQEIKPTGDGLMVAFSGATDALECAVAMQQVIQWSNRTDRHPVGLRIGIHAGEGIPADGDYYGMWVVVARRLCDAAESGQILVSDLIRDLAQQGTYNFTSLGALPLKGIPSEVPTSVVEWRPLKAPPSFSNASILVIDDEEANLSLLDRTLRKNGYANIHTSSDPRQGLALFSTVDPDLILLDLMMPELDGFEVMQELATRIPPHEFLPILVLTADIDPEAKKRALAMGAKDFLTKPLDLTEVMLRIRNLIETRELHKSLMRDRSDDASEAIERLTRIAHRIGDGSELTRTADLCRLVARRLGSSDAEADLLAAAVVLHDLGNIGVPEVILYKPGRLGPDEFEIVKMHTDIGGDILSGSADPTMRLAEEIARGHHERWDGTGYVGSPGEAVPLEVRIASAVTAYVAMTSERPYRKALSEQDARSEISGSGFDPTVAVALCSVLDDRSLSSEAPR